MLHWDGPELRATNFATGRDREVDPLDVAILHHARRWTSVGALAEVLSADSGVVGERAARLLEASLLASIHDPPHPGEEAMARWEGWNPAAGFFHSATRDLAYTGPPEPWERPLVRARSQPPPLRHRRGGRVDLPPYDRDSPLARTLLRRRTWRRFSDDPLRTRELSTLLGLTWGVQAWVGEPPVALKTSPSGGAKHAMEAYVLSRRVEGLEPGTYHYDPDAHRLTRIASTAAERDELAPLLAGQDMFGGAAVVVFMTCVFERIHYKYRFARAYRVAQMEAGHLAQTFLLVATGLGLAPFCTAALADSLVEEHLGIDGVDEAVLYAVGAGRPPPGVDWAPTPTERPLPARRPPTHAGGTGPEGRTP